MIDQPEERLLFSAEMTVEGPGEDPLRAHHQRQLGIHTASPGVP